MDDTNFAENNAAIKIALIDDTRFIFSYIEKYLGKEGRRKIEYFPLIPDDLSVLAEFDILIVDGTGIDNGTFKDGIDFIEQYEKQGRNKLIIYHSGNQPMMTKKKMLARKGVPICIKGRDPQELVDLVDNCGL